MEQSVERFSRKSGMIAAICNLVLNPAFAWLGNREMNDVPLFPAIVLDTGITCVVMALLISLFVSADTKRAVASGSIRAAGNAFRCAGSLRHLPVRPWLLGITIGCIAALLAMPCLTLAFHLLGMPSLSFCHFALLKAVYTPPVAYVAARCVILRQLSGMRI